MPASYGGARPTRLKRKKPAATPAPVTDSQSGGGYNLTPAKKQAAASNKRVAKATTVLAKKGIGGVPNEAAPIKQAVRRADVKVEKATTKLPKAQQPIERAQVAQMKRDVEEEAHAKAVVTSWKDSYEHHEPSQVTAKQLANSIRKGYGKVGGSHLLQRDATLEVTPAGDIAIKMDRRYLPDVRTPVVPRDYKPGRKYTAAQVKASQQRAEDDRATKKAETPVGSVAAKALDLTARPAYAVAGGVNAAVKGKNVAKGATAGLTGKSKILFGDILHDIGAPKGVAAAGGFVLDIGLDPTTYVTGGSASLARKSAEDAARSALKRSAKAGLTDSQAARMAARAYKQAYHQVAKADVKGATVKVAGRELPGVTKATGKTIGRVAQKVTPKGAKAFASDVNPNMAPEGVARDVADQATMASRTARSRAKQLIDKADREATALRKALGNNDSKVIDAIEAGTINELPADLRKVAVMLRSRFRHIDRLAKRVGIKGGTRRNYVPHAPAEPLKAGKGIDEHARPPQTGKRVVNPNSYKKRREGTLAEKRVQSPGFYSEDLPLLYANRMRSGHVSVEQATLNRRLADLGTEAKPGRRVEMGDGESVYHLKGSNLTKLEKSDVRALEDGKIPGKAGRYVVLNNDLVDRAVQGFAAKQSGGRIVHRFDKIQGGWKALALATPGFHVRNIVGDTQNAYLFQRGHEIPGNLKHARRTLRVANKRENAQRVLGAEPKQVRAATLGGKRIDPAKDGLKINGRHWTYDELLDAAGMAGGIKTGYAAREINDLTHSGAKGGAKKVGGKARTAKAKFTRGLQNREDLVRLSTFIAGMKRGMTPEEASHHAVSRYHFDYAQLTPLERNVARRIMPFYTWSARNIPLQARSIVTKPGKFAAYEKLRQETANGFGLSDNWQDNLDEYSGRQVGVPIKFNGATAVLSAGSPVTDLNELPGMLSPGKQLSEYFQRFASLWSPLAKAPVELFTNYSFFFRNQIEADTGPLVSAPDWVGKLPGPVKDNLGVVKGIDKRTGDEVYKWPGRAQYVLKFLSPGALGQIENLASSGTDRKGRGTPEKALGALGISVMPTDPVTTRINNLFSKLGDVNTKQAALRQQSYKGKAISADNPTPEYERLLEQAKRVNREIYRLSKKRGDKTPYGTPPPVSELPPDEQLKREFEQYQNQSVDAGAEKLRKEFEQYAKSTSKGGG